MLQDGSMVNAAAVPASAKALDVRDARILVVDDEQGSRLMCRAALESEGYEILEAADGDEAVRVFREARPELILMDAVMPRMSGIAALEAIRRLPGGPEVPVLMVTGYNDESAANQAFECGASDFIPKPVNWAVLRQRVRRTISGRRAEREVNHLAYHDALTGLPNRRLFLDRLGSAAARSRRSGASFALLFLDLDGFKRVNDRLGHEAGDELLCRVADVLREAVRAGDTVSRFGGDEFNILLEDVSGVAEAEEVAARVAEVISRPHPFAAAVTSASIGLALFPDDACESGELIRCADRAMYRAKARGGDRYLRYRPEPDAPVALTAPGRDELARLLEGGGLKVGLRPRVRAVDGVAEAWCATVWTAIDVAEPSGVAQRPLALFDEAGLTVNATEWLLASALEALTTVPGPEAPLAVELTPAQVAATGFVERLSERLDKAGLAPAAVELVLAMDGRTVLERDTIEALRRLAAAGIALSLRGLPVSVIPIELISACPVRAVVLEADACPRLLAAWAGAAGALGITLIAGGVHDRGGLSALAASGFAAAEGPGLGSAVCVEAG